MLEKTKMFIDTYEGVLVFKNLKVYDTDFASITFYDDAFHFEFVEDDFEDFEIKVDDIKDITFDNMDDIQCIYLELFNGDRISIFCM